MNQAAGAASDHVAWSPKEPAESATSKRAKRSRRRADSARMLTGGLSLMRRPEQLHALREQRALEKRACLHGGGLRARAHYFSLLPLVLWRPVLCVIAFCANAARVLATGDSDAHVLARGTSGDDDRLSRVRRWRSLGGSRARRAALCWPVVQLHLLIPAALFALFSFRYWRAVAPMVFMLHGRRNARLAARFGARTVLV